MELSARERILLTFQHQETDRAPIFGEARNVGFIERMSGQKLRGSQEEMEVITAEAYRRAGVDLLRRMMTPRWGIVKGADYDVQWDGYLNWKVGGEEAMTFPEAVEWIKNTSRQGDDAEQDAVKMIAEVNRLQGIVGESILFMPEISASCLESLYHTVGIENFSVMMYECPEVIDEALERNTTRTIRMVEVINDIYDGPVIHACDDLGMKGRTIFSPAWLREHAIPRLGRVIAKVREGGKHFAFHSCGNVTAVIPDLIAAGIEALNPIEFTSGMDLKQVKRLYGERIVLQPSTNPNVMQFGTVEEARQEVRRCFDEGAGGGGFMISFGLTQVAPVENVVASFAEAREYTGWKRR